MDLNGKRVLVVGLGKSGVASALFLKAHGARVTVSDTKTGDELHDEIPVLLDHGITVETGGHGERTFRGQDLIVVSPGIPLDAPALVQARALGGSVIGEIELAAQFLRGPIVAITGSNGKTTTTTLTGEIMTAGGFATLVGGNIGTPAIALAERSTPESVIVLEVSSFQLETIHSFRPKVAVILNVTPDHLDRHRTFEAYVDAKATNVDATIKAMESFPANIHLILGGKDKGSDYTLLNDLLRQRGKRVYTIGAAAEKIESHIKGAAEVVHAETLDNAIRRANAVAQPGDIVLLAPACASFDQFQSYNHRGSVFKEIVRNLTDQSKN